jgi:hypothetical protein
MLRSCMKVPAAGSGWPGGEWKGTGADWLDGAWRDGGGGMCKHIGCEGGHSGRTGVGCEGVGNEGMIGDGAKGPGLWREAAWCGEGCLPVSSAGRTCNAGVRGTTPRPCWLADGGPRSAPALLACDAPISVLNTASSATSCRSFTRKCCATLIVWI